LKATAEAAWELHPRAAAPRDPRLNYADDRHAIVRVTLSSVTLAISLRHTFSLAPGPTAVARS
jgi:hypothetical protein